MTVKSLDGLGFYVMQIGKGRSEGCQGKNYREETRKDNGRISL